MQIQLPSFQFDREKFKDVVHYVCASCPPERLGNVKLHKVLYFADMLFYVEHGRPITGATYQKQQFGPTAPFLSSALRDLQREGRIDVQEVEFYGFKKKEYRPLAPPSTERLSADERGFLNEVIRFVCHEHNAKEISEISHTAAWEAARLGEELPYITAFTLFPVEITDDDVSWGVSEAERIATGRAQPDPV